MCRKFKLIANIENTTISELMHYLARLCRIYVLFSIINIITLAIAIRTEGIVATINQLVGLVLYVINTCNLLWVAYTTQDYSRPETFKIQLIMLSISTLFSFNVYNTIYYGISIRSYVIVFSIISLALQASTLYIIYKLFEKVRLQSNGNNGNSSTSVNNTMSRNAAMAGKEEC